MQIGLVAVSGLDLGDRAVVLADHDVDPAAKAVRRDDALPPRQHGAAVELLDAEIGCDQWRGERVKPDQLARRVEDHRTGLDGRPVRREELVARGVVARVCVDGDRRRLQVGLRDERLLAEGRSERMRRLRGVLERVAGCDGEVKLERLGGAGERQLCADVHQFTGPERCRRHEAAAVALRVGLERPGVCAGLRADHRHGAERAERNPEKADLGLRRGVGGAGHRRDRHRTVQLRRCVERLRGAYRSAHQRRWRRGGAGGQREHHCAQREGANQTGRRGHLSTEHRGAPRGVGKRSPTAAKNPQQSPNQTFASAKIPIPRVYIERLRP